MPQYFGKPPSIDLISQASEVKAAFADKKLGRTPRDVESFAWGFLQSNFEPPMDELVIAGLPGFNSFASNPNVGSSGHPQAVDGSSGTQGPPGPSGPGLTCNEVCDCNCDGPPPPGTRGACCLPSDHEFGDCMFTTAATCASQGGVYMGHGVSCGSAGCGGIIPSTDWASGGPEGSQGNSPGCSTHVETTDESTEDSSPDPGWTHSSGEPPSIESGYPIVPGIKPKPPIGPQGSGPYFSSSEGESGECISFIPAPPMYFVHLKFLSNHTWLPIVIS